MNLIWLAFADGLATLAKYIISYNRNKFIHGDSREIWITFEKTEYVTHIKNASRQLRTEYGKINKKSSNAWEKYNQTK